MSDRWIDTVVRRLAEAASSRRGVLRLGLGGALAGLALGAGEAAAACRKPRKACAKGNQCCTGKCKKGRCAGCAAGTVMLGARPKACWPWLIWGSQGSGDGEFANPFGAAVGGNGHVYVADSENDRVQEFDAAGLFVRTWGSPGSGDGEFSFPAGVVVGGQVCVADTENHRLQQLTATGGFARRWGSPGGSDGQVLSAAGAAMDGGQVFVADAFNHRIVRVTP